jgi:hypothetical protein
VNPEPVIQIGKNAGASLAPLFLWAFPFGQNFGRAGESQEQQLLYRLGVPSYFLIILKTAVGIRHLWKNTMYHKNLQGFSRCAEQLFAATSLTAKISDVERT